MVNRHQLIKIKTSDLLPYKYEFKKRRVVSHSYGDVKEMSEVSCSAGDGRKRGGEMRLASGINGTPTNRLTHRA